MNVPLTPQLLGSLIEKGYTYVLASTAQGTDDAPIILRPVKSIPVLQHLPQGFETYYRITREPMQMACGGDTKTFLEYTEGYKAITENDVYNDNYFRMSEDFFRQVLESLEDYAVITTDTNGDINSWNTGAENLLGYREHEVLGASADIFFTPEDVAKGIPALELGRALTDGRSIDERFHMGKGGNRFWGSGLVFPLFDEEGAHRGFTKIMRNLREEINARENAPEE